MLSVFLLLGFATSRALAQTSGSGTAASPGAFQTLTGKIRWKKSLGVIPASPGSRKQHESPCTILWVAAVDPESGVAVEYVIGLERGLEQPDYYVCKYSLRLPVGQPFGIKAGMGWDGLLGLPEMVIGNYYYNGEWIGDTVAYGLRFKLADAIERTFKPDNATVTLGKVKGTFLQFELIWDRRSFFSRHHYDGVSP